MARLQVCSDSSAANGICRRAGIGRVRHLAVAQLRAHEQVRAGDFELLKWPGERNPADIFTKAVHEELIERRLPFVNVWREAGRAAEAPGLDGFSWSECNQAGASS
eukprot:14523887-Alexandrium_andersonii.AAC.1